MNKEVEDALHMLLHCSLKDTEYETQFEQYKIVRNYITNLQQENKQLKEKIKSADEFCDRYMGVNLELFDMYELLNKIREILGDKE